MLPCSRHLPKFKKSYQLGEERSVFRLFRRSGVVEMVDNRFTIKGVTGQTGKRVKQKSPCYKPCGYATAAAG